MRRLIVLALVVFPAALLLAGRWEVLSTATIGADRFIQAHPEWDGRGVLIAVCDTGVELGLPGLQTTPDGRPKILDAREFSSEGRFELESAIRDEDASGKAVHAEDGRWLYGIDALEPSLPTDGEVLVGYVRESAYTAGEVPDLNNDGDTDDVFGLVTFQPAGGADAPWVAFLDTDGDGDLADESPLHDFAVARESFHLGGGDRHADAALVTYALNLWPAERSAALFFDGNGHGTHVAGTAAGFGINGQPGYNGIAPGAQILALKLGNNSLSGGATTPGSMLRAWRYAVEKADELGMPLVIQMSYGVGSEDEGQSDAEKLIDELLDENPSVAATVSAGNEGPGLSTVGLPAAARQVIAVGAAFARTTAAEIYGIHWDTDRMFAFSSRGGELARPTVVAPGFEASAAPGWTGGRDVMRGTSMASPQGAGAVALLYSAALADGAPTRRDLVRAALVRTARPLSGYGPLDTGPGMIDVPAAWQAYRALASRDRWQPVSFDVTTESPEMSSGEGPTVFFRGDFYPRGDLRQEVEVAPVFADDAPESAVTGYYQAFDLEVGADWVRSDRPSTYIKQDRPAEIPLAFDQSRLREPGLYQTRLLGWEKGLGREQRALLGPAFAVPVAVVVPRDLGREGVVELPTRGIDAVMVERHFLRVAPWTASLELEVELPPAERDRTVVVDLFDPEGREAYYAAADADTPTLHHTVGLDGLAPGVWELDLIGAQANRGLVRPTVRVRAMPLATPPSTTISLEHAAGSAPRGTVVITPALDRTWRGSGKVSVVGAARRDEAVVNGSTVTRQISLAPDEDAVTLRLEMSASDFGLFTDAAIRISDPDGTVLVADGFTYRRAKVTLSRNDGAEPGTAYTLDILAAPADPDATPSWTLAIEELHLYSDPAAGTLLQHGDEALVLYPDHAAELDLELDVTPSQPADGFAWQLEMTLEPDDARQPELRWRMEAGEE